MIYVLFSGGIDSLACLVWAVERYGRERVVAMYYDVGQCYAGKEIVAASAMAHMMGVTFRLRTEFQLVENRDTAHIPMRNSMFLFGVSALPDADGVVLGMLKGECPPDKNPRYIRRMQAFLNAQLDRPFEILCPFAKYTKTQVVWWLIQSSYSHLYYTAERPRIRAVCGALDLLRRTVGCHDAGEIACGVCWACINRWIAFTNCALATEQFRASPGDALIDRTRRAGELFGRKVPVLQRIGWALEAYSALQLYFRAMGRGSVLRCLAKRIFA